MRILNVAPFIFDGISARKVCKHKKNDHFLRYFCRLSVMAFENGVNWIVCILSNILIFVELMISALWHRIMAPFCDLVTSISIPAEFLKIEYGCMCMCTSLNSHYIFRIYWNSFGMGMVCIDATKSFTAFVICMSTVNWTRQMQQINIYICINDELLYTSRYMQMCVCTFLCTYICSILQTGRKCVKMRK